MASVKIHDEVCEVHPVTEAFEHSDGNWTLCFQRCTYRYDDDSTEEGYRFIWRRPNGTLQAARGQARIPNAAALQRLLDAAKAEGWYS
jgi:hypothetical protein